MGRLGEKFRKGSLRFRASVLPLTVCLLFFCFCTGEWWRRQTATLCTRSTMGRMHRTSLSMSWSRHWRPSINTLLLSPHASEMRRPVGLPWATACTRRPCCQALLASWRRFHCRLNTLGTWRCPLAPLVWPVLHSTGFLGSSTPAASTRWNMTAKNSHGCPCIHSPPRHPWYWYAGMTSTERDSIIR